MIWYISELSDNPQAFFVFGENVKNLPVTIDRKVLSALSPFCQSYGNGPASAIENRAGFDWL